MNASSEMTKMPSGAHFVLVHGAYHGAWCWYKIRCLLESAGHKVTCLDLRASGIDPSDANTIFKFEEYNQPLDDVFSGLGEGEKVILVGHSAGGLNLTASLYKYPEKIQVAVYVVGQMIRNTPKVPPDYPIDKGKYDVYYGEGPDQPPTSFVYKKELVREHFYQRSPLEDITLAEMLLRPVPIRALRDAAFPDDHGKEIDEVPRVYIKTLDDNTISQEGQDALINKWPPSALYAIDSDHSPFFSNPFELFGLLLKVSTNNGCQHKS